jgi:hypothetical protein
MNNNLKKFEIGDMVLFAPDQSTKNIGIIIKKIRKPFIENYKVHWSDGKIWTEDKWYMKHGWKGDGWLSPYDLTLFAQNRKE